MNDEKSLFMSENELFILTGYKQLAKQMQWLQAHDFYFINDGRSSSIRLSRDHVRQKLNGKNNTDT
jgi:hypothetical protein